jgi:hypothetical protein
MISKYLFRNDLCILLSIDEKKKYSLKEIEKLITSTNLKKANSLFNGYSRCNCGNCILTKNDFINIIKEYLIINESEPTCYFFEFNQKPIEINEL